MECVSIVGETKEILQKQLELLSEYSKNNTLEPDDLAKISDSMVRISALLMSGQGLSAC